jgi:hypothetical protein
VPGRPWQDRSAGRDLVDQILAVHEHSASCHAEDGSELTQAILTLRLRAVWFLNQLGESAAQAILVAEPLLAVWALCLGPAHPDTLTYRNNLAAAYQEAGRPAEAIALHQRALADRGQILGPGHPTTQRFASSTAAPQGKADATPGYCEYQTCLRRRRTTVRGSAVSAHGSRNTSSPRNGPPKQAEARLAASPVPRAAGRTWSGGPAGTPGDWPGGTRAGASGHLAGKLPDPPHGVGGRLGVVAELLSHPAGAATDAELPHDAADRLRRRLGGRGVRWPQL